jgi:3-hydroxy-9,10-secoandrosta-1,3,5(10)-triene-9,17-dione monooxygenase reductase component
VATASKSVAYVSRLRGGDSILPSIAAEEFRQVLGHFPTGVCVVAAFDGETPVGMAVNSMTSVSLDPPLVLVCPAGTSTTWPAVRVAGQFCISVMASHHEQISRVFSSRSADRFDRIAWHCRTGGPALDEAVAWLDCRLWAEHPAGDHTIAVCEVIAGESSQQAATPLVFFRGRYGSFVDSRG